MTLETLLEKRRNNYYKKLSKYVKYVMNDHFVLAVVFLLGALAYQYSNFIKSLDGDFHLGKIVVALLLAAAPFMGKIATLATAADQVFLAVKEKEWQAHIAAAKKRSLIIPAVFILLLTAVAMPILFVGQPISLANFAFILLIGLILKWLHLNLEEVNLRFAMRQEVVGLKKGLYLVGVIFYLAAFFLHPLVGPVLAGLTAIISESKLKKMRQAHIDWELTVQSEENRLAKINRLINLFIDAPSAKDHAKRRKYLDGLVGIMSGKDQAFQYLFTRIFVRGNSYFGLYIRLSLIGVIILAVTGIPVISLFLNLLLLYMTGFQVLPLYNQLNENAMVRLYPQEIAHKLNGFARLITLILSAEGIVFAVATAVGTDILTGALAFALNIIFIVFFARIYVLNRVKKRDSKAF